MSESVHANPFASKKDLQKAFTSLVGIVEGIVIDAAVNEKEIGALRDWVSTYEPFRPKHPFNEVFPLIEQVLYERHLTEDERQDILWLCEKLSSEEFLDKTVRDMQRLHALLKGIMADGVITETELTGLKEWMQQHEHLRKSRHYEQIETIVAAVMSDRKVDAQEQKVLQDFFASFDAFLTD